jgi:hypothetical protein
VIDKRRRQREREGENYLLSLSLLTQQIREEVEQRQTVSDICIWNKKRGMKKK